MSLMSESSWINCHDVDIKVKHVKCDESCSDDDDDESGDDDDSESGSGSGDKVITARDK